MNLKPLLLSVAIVASLNAAAQTNTPTVNVSAQDVYKIVDVMPRAPYDMGEYLGSQLHYPDSARAHGVEGRVLIKFVVNKKGGIEQCTLLKGIGSGCDEEALRVVSHMPAWIPGKKNGEPVAVYFTLPISFRLK